MQLSLYHITFFLFHNPKPHNLPNVKGRVDFLLPVYQGGCVDVFGITNQLKIINLLQQ